jgi:TonB family protein
MPIRRIIAAAALVAAGPALGQAAQSKADRDEINWDVFQKLYPPRALVAREEGAVGFVVTLDNRGDVTNCQVTHSSGHPLLDEETCKVVTLNAQFNADPGLSPSQTRTHEGLIAWKLPESLKVLAPPEPIVVVSSGPEKVVCKKNLKMGTLSGYERICMTPTEWAKQSDDMKQVYDDMQGRKGSSNAISIGDHDSTLGRSMDARTPGSPH